MKRILSFLLCMGLIALHACKPEPDPYLTVSPDSLAFPQEGGAQTVRISANNAWTASVSGSGFSLSSNSGTGDATLTVTASPASATDPSSGTLTISSSGLSASVKLSQDAKTVLLVGDSAIIPAEGGSYEVNVQYNTDFTVEVEASAQSWITFVKTKAVQNGKLEFQFAANENTEPRTGKVTVKDDAGKVTPLTITFIQEEKKVIQVGETTIIPAEGGSYEVDVQYNTDFTVEVETSAQSWITFVKTKALQNGKLEFQFAANESTEPRTGKVTVKDNSGKVDPLTLTFIQEEKKVINVGETTTIPAEGGTFEVDVQYNTDFSVEVEESAQSWITFIKTRALQNGKLEFMFAANETTEPRTGKVTVKDNSGKVAPISLTFIQEEKKVINVGETTTIPAEGGTFEVDVQYNTDFSVEVEVSAQSWITFIKTRALQNGKLEFMFAANETAEPRTGRVTVRDNSGKVNPLTLTFVQEEKKVINVGETTTIPAEGGTFEVDVQYNTDFTVEVEESAQSWITFIKTRALQNGKLEFMFAANETTEPRTGKVIVRDNSGKVNPLTLTFIQEEKKVINVGETTTIPAEGGTFEVDVQYNTDFTVEVEESAQGWITFIKTRALQNGKLEFKFAANETTEPRTGRVTVRDNSGKVNPLTLTFVQEEKKVINVGETTTIPAEGGTFEVDVQYNTDFSVEIEESAQSWITFIKTRALQNGKLEFKFAANETTEPRTGKVTVKDNSVKVAPITLTFIQEEKKVINVGETTTIPAEGGTFEVDVQYNTDFTVEVEESAQSWITFIKTRALQNGKLEFWFAPNETTEPRTGKVTIKDNSGKVSPQTLTFVQEKKIEVESVTLDKDRIEIEIEERLQLTVTVAPENAADKIVTWESDKPWIASVDENGLVTGVTIGKAIITAKAGEKSASCAVTVKSCNYEIERAALEAFYKANDGDDWTRRDNWCTDAPLNEWYGVRMSPDQKHVVDLSLWNNQVIGYIPREIGDLTELESLGISCTPEQTYGLPQSLFGPLPEEIGKLKRLTYLYLQDYPLTGNLPEGLFSLPELEILGIIRPLYTDGALSPSIGNLTSLRSLELDKVNLTGSLPAELGQLNNLTYANLELNSFSGTIPSSFAGLVNLEHLLLLNNGLSGPLPATLANIPRFPLIWGEMVELNLFSQEDLRASKIPAPTSPKVKAISGQVLDIEAFIRRNKYTVLFNVAPEYSDATEYLTRLENLYKKGKDKGLGVLTYFDNNSQDESAISSRDNLFKDILQKSGAEWDSFIRYMYKKYPDGAPFHAPYGNAMYPGGRTNQIVIIGPDGTVDYTTLIDWDLENDIEHALNYLEQVLDVSMTYYESQSYERDGAVTQLQKASSGKGIDLVITGDAFSDRDLTNGTFEKAARQAMKDFFSVEPVKSLKDRFNVYMVEAVSKNDEYFSGCSTAFSGVFGSGSAVGGDHGKVLEYARKAVKDETRMDNVFTLVLMNSYRDGGTCYMFDPVDERAYAGGSSVAWVTYKDVNTSGGLSSLASTIVHEAVGHGLGKLADEYAYLMQGEVSEAEAAYIRKVQKWNWYMNIALTSTLSELPWSRFIGDSAFASENIGAYQGGDTFWSGVWRPTEQSVMNDSYNHSTFNAPSRAQLYTRIMKLSEGQDWQFDYETFVGWDQAHPTKMSSAPATRSNYVEVDDAENTSHVPPVFLGKTWRQIIQR